MNIYNVVSSHSPAKYSSYANNQLVLNYKFKNETSYLLKVLVPLFITKVIILFSHILQLTSNRILAKL